MTAVFNTLHGKVKHPKFGDMMFLLEYFGKEQYGEGVKWVTNCLQKLITAKPEDRFLLHVYMRLFGMYQRCECETLRSELIPIMNRVVYAFRNVLMTSDAIIMITKACAKNQTAHLLLLSGAVDGVFYINPAELDVFISNVEQPASKRKLNRMAVVSPSELSELLKSEEPNKKKRR